METNSREKDELQSCARDESCGLAVRIGFPTPALLPMLVKTRPKHLDRKRKQQLYRVCLELRRASDELAELRSVEYLLWKKGHFKLVE